MRVKVFDSHFEKATVTVNLSLWQWLKLKFLGGVYVYHAAKRGWKGQLPFHIIKCGIHGFFLDYPHGYNPYFLCPLCFNESYGGANH